VRPPNSQWVHVTITDGCSDSYSDSVYINVFPKIETDAITSDTQCYGTVGFAELQPRLTDPYSVRWFTTPPRFTTLEYRT
jgi:hypothetical protein